MPIPSRLSRTTLGDILGELSREQVSGTLELIESTRTGNVIHEISFEAGKIAGVRSSYGRTLADHLGRWVPEVEGARAGPIGDSLVGRGIVSPEELEQALQLQRSERLELLFALSEAEVRFRPRRSSRPHEPEPLPTIPLLRGRRRARDRFQAEAPHARALRTLGLSLGASPVEVRQAFRALAGALHPDKNPGLSDEERRDSVARFSELSRAYHKLIA